MANHELVGGQTLPPCANHRLVDSVFSVGWHNHEVGGHSKLFGRYEKLR